MQRLPRYGALSPETLLLRQRPVGKPSSDVPEKAYASSSCDDNTAEAFLVLSLCLHSYILSQRLCDRLPVAPNLRALIPLAIFVLPEILKQGSCCQLIRD